MDHREAMIELHQEDRQLPTYEQLKELLTGYYALREDMCTNSCVAFTGPYAHLEACPFCSEPRYDVIETARTSKRVPRRTFHTFPLGPQIQAMYSLPENASHMGYRAAVTRDILGHDETLDGMYHGSDYLDAVQAGEIADNDAVVMLSLDGAQLLRIKTVRVMVLYLGPL